MTAMTPRQLTSWCEVKSKADKLKAAELLSITAHASQGSGDDINKLIKDLQQ